MVCGVCMMSGVWYLYGEWCACGVCMVSVCGRCLYGECVWKVFV